MKSILVLKATDPTEAPKQNAPVFYSGLRRLLERKMPAAATPEMVQSLVSQRPKEEQQWHNLQLDGPKVTKRDVLEQVDQRTPIPTETVLGTPQKLEWEPKDFNQEEFVSPHGDFEYEIFRANQRSNGYGLVQNHISGTTLPLGMYPSLKEAQKTAESHFTRKAKYKIEINGKPIYTPGIRNYQEILMQLPPGSGTGYQSGH